jgi:hypothetical protein
MSVDSSKVTTFFQPWSQPNRIDLALKAAMEGDDLPLFRYLEKALPLNVAIYLIERLQPARAGAPHKSVGDKYQTHARKPISVAAILANEILRERGDTVERVRLSKAVKRDAATDAIKLLQKQYPGKYRIKPDDVVDRMPRLRKIPFRPIFEYLPRPSTK